MRRDILFFGILLLALGALLFFDPAFSWQAQRYLYGGAEQGEINTLHAENIALRAELTALKGRNAAVPSATGIRAASVYSRYPFNVKNEFLAGAGKQEGVREGDSVLLFGDKDPIKILVGKVEKVFKSTALVETIFDERWHSAVRIGDQGYDALLEGGISPRLTLIAKDARIVSGDIVVSADPAFAYGLAIGEIKSVAFSSDQVFQEAELSFPYNLNFVRAVGIMSHDTGK